MHSVLGFPGIHAPIPYVVIGPEAKCNNLLETEPQDDSIYHAVKYLWNFVSV